MAEILRIPINWSGFIGAPGYTNLFFKDFNLEGITQEIVDSSVAKVDAFCAAMVNRLPSSVTVEVPAALEVIEETNGMLQRFVSGTPNLPVSGGQTGTYAAASGACVNWYTNGVRNGRRVRGRTFLVPLSGNSYENDGTLASAALTQLRDACTALTDGTGAGDLGIWSRPSLTGNDGIWYVVDAFTVPDKAAVLRTRRD